MLQYAHQIVFSSAILYHVVTDSFKASFLINPLVHVHRKGNNHLMETRNQFISAVN